MFTGLRPVISEYFSIRVLREPAQTPFRCAIVVAAKMVALATKRNLYRRRITESVRRIIASHPPLPGTSVVVAVRTPHIPAAAALDRELMSLMKKSGIV